MATKVTRKTATSKAGTTKASPARSKARRPSPARRPPQARPELLAIGCLALAGFMAVALAIPGSAGIVGSDLVWWLRYLLGSGAWSLPCLLILWGISHVQERPPQVGLDVRIGSALLFLSYLAWWHLVGVSREEDLTAAVFQEHSGILGAALGTALRVTLGEIGGLVVLGAVATAGLVTATGVPALRLLHGLVRKGGRGALAAGWALSDAAVREREKLRSARAARRPAGDTEEPAVSRWKRFASRERKTEVIPEAAPAAEVRPYEPPVVRDYLEDAPAPVPVVEEEEAAPPPPARRKAPPKPKVTAKDAPVLPLEDGDEEDKPFELPPVTLLKPQAAAAKQSQDEREHNVRILEDTLATFKIDARVVEICRGPTVTRYEIQLAPGIKVQKIVSLADNLAMSLAAIDVRVEAPIPGKSAIGVEVPNRTPTPVMLRQVLESPELRDAPSKLTVALGLDVAGQPRTADLAKMPHLLVGGSTNSGKSVCLNALIASLLFRATPEEVKLLLIDPKRVELSLYDHIPHLVYPVVKDVKQAAGVLRWALKEMDRRYDVFVETGSRNIDSYNKKMMALRESGGEEARPLPYLVIIIDELADLMMQIGPEVETSICRLAQLARATGIHLVIATQRPSVNVITGTIKANISSRIAFAVASHTDSRTILNCNGAERLVGRGDMLFLPIDASKPTRIQGAYVGESEIEALVDHLKAQAKPDYEAEVLTVDSSAIRGGNSGDADTESDDQLFEQCVRLVVTTGHASTSMLQRKFKIGYTRAARLVDMMEEQGIVGPMDNAKPREVLMSKESLNAYFTDRYGRNPTLPEDEDEGE